MHHANQTNILLELLFVNKTRRYNHLMPGCHQVKIVSFQKENSGPNLIYMYQKLNWKFVKEFINSFEPRDVTYYLNGVSFFSILTTCTY